MPPPPDAVEPPLPNKLYYLKGKTSKEAKHFILRDWPFLKVEILKEGAPTTDDVDEHRVRLFVDDAGVVRQIPERG